MIALQAVESFRRSLWVQAGWQLTCVVPFGWVALSLAMRAAFARRSISLRAGWIAAALVPLVAVGAELWLRHSFAALMAELHTTHMPEGMDLALHDAHTTIRAMGGSVFCFAAILLVVATVRQRGRRGEAWASPPRWRLGISTLVLWLGAYFATPSVFVLTCAVLFRDRLGAHAAIGGAAFTVGVAALLGAGATWLRDGQPTAVVAAR